jgi:hypothetical protein
MAVNEVPDRRAQERRFFALVAITFPLIVLAGFARTYYLKGFFDGEPVVARSLIHVHGIVMTAWVLLFVGQVSLVRSRNIRLHQRLGFAGIGLAILVVAVGFFTGIQAAKYGSATAPPDIPPLSFLVVPIGDILNFAILFGAAVYFRRRPDYHKRLMVLTVFNFLPPAIGRVWPPLTQAFGPLWFYGFPDVILIGLIVFDTWRNRKLHPALAVGAVLLIASHPIRLMLSGSDAWLRVAAWLTA